MAWVRTLALSLSQLGEQFLYVYSSPAVALVNLELARNWCFSPWPINTTSRQLRPIQGSCNRCLRRRGGWSDRNSCGTLWQKLARDTTRSIVRPSPTHSRLVSEQRGSESRTFNSYLSEAWTKSKLLKAQNLPKLFYLCQSAINLVAHRWNNIKHRYHVLLIE